MWVAVGLAGATVVYVGTSVFFLLRPWWLHKHAAHNFLPATTTTAHAEAKPDHHTRGRRKRLHISHRGGASEQPENTLAAFAHAVDAGSDMLELDVFFTKDRQVVVSHDQVLTRLTAKEVDVRDTNFADLPPYQRSILQGHFSPPPEDTSAGRFCLLGDVFRQFPQTLVHLEIKQYEEATELVHATAKLIKDHGRTNLTVWGSFSAAVTAECASLYPDIPRYFGTTGVLKLLALFYSGLLPFVAVEEACLSIPMPSSPRLFAGARNRGWLARLAVGAAVRLLERPALFRHLQRRGLHVYLWVLNDEADFKYAYDTLGADGVMTDRPSVLAEFLSRSSSSGTRAHER